MSHIVRSGETLGRIAVANGITLDQLLDANPQFRANPDVIHPGDVVIIPGEETKPLPPPPPPSAPSGFTERLASIAQGLRDRFQGITEGNPTLCREIRIWTESIHGEGPFVSCTSNDHPWSAVFVSWCVKEAGATGAEFQFSKAHSVFVHKAIQDAINETGVFRGLRITDHAPKVGDIVHLNRGGASFTFDHARDNLHYSSHSIIVVETGEDERGRFARCIGGNETNAIRSTRVQLTSEGFVQQRSVDPFICVIETLK